MSGVYVGIDTSCYTTSVAAVSDSGIISLRQSLNVAHGERGLKQSDAFFQHIRELPGLIERLTNVLNSQEIAAIGVSVRPRDTEGSYMPVFLAGASVARCMAASLRVRCVECSHQDGHIAAAKLNSGLNAREFLAMHLSGGTTEILRVCGHNAQLIGGTSDLNAGQFVDRVGVALGLPFPAGPELEKFAITPGAKDATWPCSTRGMNCSFSGAETRAQRAIAAGERPCDAALSTYSCLARTIAKVITCACAEAELHEVLIAGGVAGSALFRRMLSDRLSKERAYFGAPEYSGDNAVGAALIAKEMCNERTCV